MALTTETYAHGRTICDADSHIMELPEWLASYADPGIRDRIRPLYLGAAGSLAEDAVARGRPARATSRPRSRSKASS